MTTFNLIVKPKNAACNDRGVAYEIDAPTWAKACSEAKKKVKNIDMVYDQTDGPLICIRN